MRLALDFKVEWKRIRTVVLGAVIVAALATLYFNLHPTKVALYIDCADQGELISES